MRPQAAQWRVTRPPWASSDEDRCGVRVRPALELQEGQTSGFWSRSAAIRISASGARYSLMPRRPTVGPSGGVWWHGSGYPTFVLNLPEAIRARKGLRQSAMREGTHICAATCGRGARVWRLLAASAAAARRRRRTWCGWSPTRRRTTTASSPAEVDGQAERRARLPGRERRAPQHRVRGRGALAQASRGAQRAPCRTGPAT